MSSILKSSRLSTIPAMTVWSEFTPLAMKHNAINLGQGFPSFGPPDFVKDSLQSVLAQPESMNHQYCRSMGHPALVKELQNRYSDGLGRQHAGGVTMDEVLITNGVTQALNCAMQAFLSPGDEVLMLEPFFDVYPNDVVMAGGVPVTVPLQFAKGGDASTWTIDWDALEGAVSSTGKTKMFIFNTPQNVPGKVWSKEDIQRIADFSKRHNLLVISDEVYEYMTYDGTEHLHLANLPGMWDRTLTMSSAGKTFSCTGWKIGWTVGPAHYIQSMAQIHAHQAFSVSTPNQMAVAKALQHASSSGYYREFRDLYEGKRNLLCDLLGKAGLEPVIPQGSFFVLADISRVKKEVFHDEASPLALDWQFCRWATEAIGVTAIPTTAFCKADKARYQHFARFAFCKDDEYMRQGGDRLLKLRQYLE